MSAKRDARLNRIVELLSRQQKLDVASLSEQIGVSQVTVRKDLDELEKKGFIERTHGYAQLNMGDQISSRLTYHYNEKRTIATAAAKLIHDSDTLMIENGSCCALLASILAQTKNDITIITNSAFIAGYIREYKNVQCILLGGLYQHESQCLVGPMIRDMVENYHVKYFFVGTDGWNQHAGFTNKDAMRAQAVRDMAHSCEQMVILTESEKFHNVGTMPLNVKNQPKIVITDDNLPDTIKQQLIGEGMDVIIA